MLNTSPQPSEPMFIAEKSKSIWPVILITVVITALLVGGGVYALQTISANKKIKNLEKEIKTLQDQIGQKTDNNQQDKNKQDDLSSWQTYRNETYGFEIKFPSGWFIYNDLAGSIFLQPDKEIESKIPGPHANSLELKTVDKGGQDFNTYINNFYGDIKFVKQSVTLGGQKGYLSYSVCEGVGCGSHAWFVEYNNKFYILKVILGDGEVYQKIVNTLKLFKPTVNDPTANWQTYHNEELWFEFKYPNEFLVSKEYKNCFFISNEDKSGNFCIIIWDKKLDPNNIISIYGPIESKNIEEIIIADNVTSYNYSEIDAGHKTLKTVIPKNNKTVELSFGDCVSEECKTTPYFNISNYKPQIISTFKFTDPTDNWQIYRNDEYGFEFKYPKEYFLNDASTNELISFDSEGPGAGLNIEIKKESLSNKINEFKQTEQNLITKTFNEKKWTIFYHKGEGTVTGSWYTAVTQLDNKNIIIITLNRSGTEELFNQILSTFKFIE